MLKSIITIVILTILTMIACVKQNSSKPVEVYMIDTSAEDTLTVLESFGIDEDSLINNQ